MEMQQLILAGIPGFLTFIWLDKLDAIHFDLPANLGNSWSQLLE